MKDWLKYSQQQHTHLSDSTAVPLIRFLVLVRTSRTARLHAQCSTLGYPCNPRLLSQRIKLLIVTRLLYRANDNCHRFVSRHITNRIHSWSGSVASVGLGGESLDRMAVILR